MKKADWRKWCNNTGACKSGLDECEKVFRSGTNIEPHHMVSSEISFRNKMWAVFKMASTDNETKNAIVEWINDCCSELGIKHFNIKTDEGITLAIRQILRTKSRTSGLSEAKNWATSKLSGILERRGNGSGKMASNDC